MMNDFIPVPDPKQFHWVVMYDENSKGFFVDVDETLNKYGEEATYDIFKGRFEENDPFMYGEKEEELAIILDNANRN